MRVYLDVCVERNECREKKSRHSNFRSKSTDKKKEMMILEV
jgi:hypothetical protein